ncbi:MAG: glycosyl transferase group 1 family protein, partial [Solirubrobacterales bacterium]|nr:glycosyl transferase group 1 family protein [Solirubrobacterales bacterium]
MRVLVVDPYYPAFLDAHYAARPELREAPYAKQLEALLTRQFGTGDAYSRELRALGHEAREVIPNAEPLQRAWAREHGG